LFSFYFFFGGGGCWEFYWAALLFFSQTQVIFFLFLFPIRRKRRFSNQVDCVMSWPYILRDTHIRNKCLAFVFSRLDTIRIASAIKPENRITSWLFSIVVCCQSPNKRTKEFSSRLENGLGQSLTIDSSPWPLDDCQLLPSGDVSATGPCVCLFFCI
jgi:hypothetical protein